jgi:hypothetical protein
LKFLPCSRARWRSFWLDFSCFVLCVKTKNEVGPPDRTCLVGRQAGRVQGKAPLEVCFFYPRPEACLAADRAVVSEYSLLKELHTSQDYNNVKESDSIQLKIN